MRDRKVAVRYAQALLEVAIDRGVVDDVHESFDGVSTALAEHGDLFVFLQSPQVRTAEKKALLKKVFGDRVEPVLAQFFELLLDKDRILNLLDIHTEFDALVEAHQGKQRVTVATAVPLADDLEQQLRKRLQSLTGKKIILEKKVDPSVIGGVCVTMGDEILDGTLRTGLDRLRATLEKSPLRPSEGDRQ